MPLYEYKCNACAHRFERIVKFSDAPVTTCPKCGQDTLNQLISAPAVLFKGSGWYVTDYAHKGANQGSSSEQSDSAKVQGGSETAPASKGDHSGSVNGSGNGNGGPSESTSSSRAEKASVADRHSSALPSSSATSSSSSSSSSSNTSSASGSGAKSSNGDSK